MCGQLGVLFGRINRSKAEIDYITDLFTELLLLSEARGRHASGLAWLKTDSYYNVFKSPVLASVLVEDPVYCEILSGVDENTAILMGHTRWMTKGSEQNNDNNHPQVSELCLGTHNGTIINADYLFWRYKLKRCADVDSELIFRIADTAVKQKRIDISILIDKLSLCYGQISAVIVSKLDPGTIIIIKGNKPLFFRYHDKYKVILYASDNRFIDMVLAGESGWDEIIINPMNLITFKCNNLLDYRLHPLYFTGNIK